MRPLTRGNERAHQNCAKPRRDANQIRVFDFIFLGILGVDFDERLGIAPDNRWLLPVRVIVCQ